MKSRKTEFEKAGEQPQPTLLQEFVQLLRYNKKYWLIPLVVGLLGFGLIIVLGGTALAPFIYQLF